MGQAHKEVLEGVVLLVEEENQELVDRVEQVPEDSQLLLHQKQQATLQHQPGM